MIPDIAKQIAELLNSENQLVIPYAEQKILDKAIKHSKLNNGRVIQCTIREDNNASIGLFSKNDFNKVSVFNYPNSGNNVGIWQKVISVAV